MVWQTLLSNSGPAQENVPEGYVDQGSADLVKNKFIQFMAVVNAYKLMVQQQQMQAQPAAPPPAGPE